MSKVEDIQRHWIDKASGAYMRPWTEEESKTIDCHTHIFEKHWRHYCPVCGCIGLPTNKEQALLDLDIHRAYTGHEGEARYEDCELICLEYRYELRDDIGQWVHVQERF